MKELSVLQKPADKTSSKEALLKSPGCRNSSNIMGLNMHTIQKFLVRRTVS
jgi:hypothetical protein